MAASLPWRPGVWLLEEDRSTLTTYAGDRINRTLARVLQEALDVKVTGNYWQVSIARGPTPNAVRGAIRAWAAATPEDRLAELARTTKTWRFSPFADCVPDHLAQIALAERTLDVRGAAEGASQLNG